MARKTIVVHDPPGQLADPHGLSLPFPPGWTQWKPGDRLAINRIAWDASEVLHVLDVFRRDWFASGHYVNALQDALREFNGETGVFTKYILTNSGTAALEVAVQTLLHAGRIHPGDLVLHPTCTFNTSAACFTKFGLIPVFVDVCEGTYNLDPDLALDAIDDLHPKLIVLPHLIGNTTHISRVVTAALVNDIPVIGDSCDTLGTKWNNVEVGYWTDLTAYSFYGSHHITTGGVGGALRVNWTAEDLYEAAHSMVYWGRDFKAADGDVLTDFRNRYNYLTLGTDSQMSEMQAAFGLAQLAKLPAWIKRRAEVFASLYALMQDYEDLFILPVSYPECTPSWFGFPLTVREGAPFTRDELVERLLARNVELRPLFSGNAGRQKAFQGINYIQFREPKNADRNMTSAFFVPAWAMADDAEAFLLDALRGAIEEARG